MVLPYVCNECRRSLLRRATALGCAQWTARAAFTSLTDSVAEILPQQQNDPSRPRRESKGRHSESLPRSNASHIHLNELFAYNKQRSQPETRGRYSRYSQEQLEEEFGDVIGNTKDVSRLQAKLDVHGQESSQAEKLNDSGHIGHTALGGIEVPTTEILNPSPQDQNHVLKPQQVQPDSTQRVQRSQAEPLAAKLDAILRDESKGAAEAYKFFARKYRHRNILALQKPALQDRSLLLKGIVFSRLLRKVTVAWCEAQELEEGGLPSPSQLLSQLASLHVHRPEHVLYPLQILLHNLYKQNIVDSQDDPTPLEYEILKLWAYMFKHFGITSSKSSTRSTAGEAPQTTAKSNNQKAEHAFDVSDPIKWSIKSIEAFSVDWSSLPRMSTLSFMSPTETRAKAVKWRLRTCISTPSEHLGSLGATALATFDHFSHRLANHSLDDIADDVEPFMKFMARVVYQSDVHLSVTAFEEQALEVGIDETIVREASNRMRDYPLQGELIVASSLGVKGAHTLSRESLEAYFSSRLGKALEKSNLQEVLRLWNHATRAYKNISDHEKGAALSLADSEEDANAGALPSKLYSTFLHTLTGLGRHESAVEVWNYMVQHGTKPTAHQYNAMMQGAVRQRDAEAPERIWRMMINSGVEIDVSSWNTRVHAMALSGRSVNAIGLLEEMSDLWQRSQLAQGKKTSTERSVKAQSVPAAVKPSVETFNACVTVFARKGRRDLIQRAFAWANREGIKPDHITFNALISLALRTHNVPDAMKLFGQMLQQGVTPDDATFAIILNALFRSVTIREMTPQQQKALVKDMLEGISALGLGTGSAANHVYAMFIDRLLKDHGNMEGAQMVMGFMREKDVVITPHIYTSLMTHYFQGVDEPNFTAIENLWSKMRSEGAAMDHLFFDRMVEMYARAGETGHALMFLGRMSNQGCKPSKSALMELLEALMRHGQWDRVRELVTDIKEEKGLVKGGIKVNVRPGFERKFWAFIEDVENEMEFVYSRSESRAIGTATETGSAMATPVS